MVFSHWLTHVVFIKMEVFFLIISIEVNGSRIIVSNSHSYYFLDAIKPECWEVEQEIVWTVKKRDIDYSSERLLPWY